MRRMILTSLVLLPVMANAQARTSTEPQPSKTVAVSELSAPAKLATVPVSSLRSSEVSTKLKVSESAQPGWAEDVLRKGGTLEYALMGSVPNESSAPKLTRAVEVGLSQQELDTQPAVMNVVVRATVDEFGFPRNLAVTHSAGAEVDKKALAAVSQYRFKPATIDSRAVNAPVLISIKIKKN